MIVYLAAKGLSYMMTLTAYVMPEKTRLTEARNNCRECYAVSGNEAAAKRTGIGGKRIV